MEHVIRLATEQDITGYQSFVVGILSERLETLISRVQPPTPEQTRQFVLGHLGAPSALFIAESEGQIIGALDLTRPERPELNHRSSIGMSVAAPFRRKGVGRALLQTAAQWASAHGIERIELEVLALNLAAIKLYEAQSFVREGVRRQAIKRGDSYIDLIMYAKQVE